MALEGIVQWCYRLPQYSIYLRNQCQHPLKNRLNLLVLARPVIVTSNPRGIKSGQGNPKCRCVRVEHKEERKEERWHQCEEEHKQEHERHERCERRKEEREEREECEDRVA